MGMAVRVRFAYASILLALAGCASDAGERREATREGSVGAASRVERCTDRMLTRARLESYSASEREGLRRYARTTYCKRFEQHGWIYDDGALRIDAHRWLQSSGFCASSEAVTPGQSPKLARRVPCEQLLGDDPLLDCALLHHVRRREVQAYLQSLERPHAVRCDDGTPLDELGVP